MNGQDAIKPATAAIRNQVHAQRHFARALIVGRSNPVLGGHRYDKAFGHTKKPS